MPNSFHNLVLMVVACFFAKYGFTSYRVNLCIVWISCMRVHAHLLLTFGFLLHACVIGE